jgi:hypothetical protein
MIRYITSFSGGITIFVIKKENSSSISQLNWKSLLIKGDGLRTEQGKGVEKMGKILVIVKRVSPGLTELNFGSMPFDTTCCEYAVSNFLPLTTGSVSQ